MSDQPVSHDFVLAYGAAPNAQVNTSLATAQSMHDYWVNLGIEQVVGIFVNCTTPPGPFMAPMININDIEPPLTADDPPLFYQVQIIQVGAEVPEPFMNQYAVSQWQPIINANGERWTVMQYLNIIDPAWINDPDKCAVVYTLPAAPPPPPPPPPGPPAPPIPEATGLASPNWLVWVPTACLAVRDGDYSPADGTTHYSDAKHGSWVKIADHTPATPFAPQGSLINQRWTKE